MNGLNAYPRSVPRFQSGGSTGFSIGTAPAPTGGVLDAFTSPMQGTPTISTPFGTTHGLSMSTLVGHAVPTLAAPLAALSLANSLYGAFNAKQEPAPIDDAVVDAYSPPTPGIAIGAPAAVSVEGISPGYTEPGKAQSVLESMIATQQAEQAQAQTEANQAMAAQQAVDAAMDVTTLPVLQPPVLWIKELVFQRLWVVVEEEVGVGVVLPPILKT
jgi:hypothetical protein